MGNDHDRNEHEPVNVTVHVYIGGEDARKISDALAHQSAALARISNDVKQIQEGVFDMAQKQSAIAITLDSLTARVQAQGTQEDSILALVQGLVAASGGDPVKLQALSDALDADDAKLKALSDAVTAPGTGGTGGGTGTGVLTVLPSGGIALAVGGTQQLIVDDASGVDVTGTSTFSVDNPSVASVSTSGLVTGAAAGAAVITAKSADGSASGTVNVTVS